MSDTLKVTGLTFDDDRHEACVRNTRLLREAVAYATDPDRRISHLSLAGGPGPLFQFGHLPLGEAAAGLTLDLGGAVLHNLKGGWFPDSTNLYVGGHAAFGYVDFFAYEPGASELTLTTDSSGRPVNVEPYVAGDALFLFGPGFDQVAKARQTITILGRDDRTVYVDEPLVEGLVAAKWARHGRRPVNDDPVVDAFEVDYDGLAAWSVLDVGDTVWLGDGVGAAELRGEFATVDHVSLTADGTLAVWLTHPLRRRYAASLALASPGPFADGVTVVNGGCAGTANVVEDAACVFKLAPGLRLDSFVVVRGTHPGTYPKAAAFATNDQVSMVACGFATTLQVNSSFDWLLDGCDVTDLAMEENVGGLTLAGGRLFDMVRHSAGGCSGPTLLGTKLVDVHTFVTPGGAALRGVRTESVRAMLLLQGGGNVVQDLRTPAWLWFQPGAGNFVKDVAVGALYAEPGAGGAMAGTVHASDWINVPPGEWADQTTGGTGGDGAGVFVQ